jgi:RNA polymerase sigma factor for flagellar operon FliA
VALILLFYAEFRIRGEIIDELRKQDWMSRSERNKQKKFKKAKRDLTEELGRNPSEDELVNVLPFKRKDVVRMEQYETGEMIKPYVEGETVLLGGLKNTEFESYELKKTLSTMIDDLPKVMRIIVVLKYFEDLNFSEISKVVNLSEGRVCQLHAEALDMMKGEMETIDILNVA